MTRLFRPDRLGAAQADESHGRPTRTIRACPLRPDVSGSVTAADLVGLGFRNWLAGYLNNDVGCWTGVWSLYATRLELCAAKPVVAALSVWVRDIHVGACRKIQVSAPSCATYCRDECMAISIIAAAQNDTCPAMRACAFALLGTSNIDPVINSAERYARTLSQAGLTIEPAAIAPAVSPEAALTGTMH